MHQSLLAVMRDVILGNESSESLDPYCYARVKFWAECVVSTCPTEKLVDFLSKLSCDTLHPPPGLPRLLEALPPKKRLGVLMAGLWLEDKDGVAQIAMEISKNRSELAVRDAGEWFRKTSPSAVL